MKRMKSGLLSSLSGAALLAIGGVVSAQAQQVYDGAPWRFGAFGGMNFNIVGTGAQTLALIGNEEFAQQHVNGNTDIIDGTGLGFYFGLLGEYNPGGLFGGQLRVGMDDRRVMFNDWDVPNPSNETRFTARMTYVSVEPMLRVNLGSPNFHAVAGPLLSFKVATKYDYTPGRDETNAAVVVDQPIENTNSFTYGVSGGLGYDLLLNSKSTSGTKWYLTPFVEASYMMDQRKNDRPTDRNDTWVTTSIRGGFELKFGSAPSAPPPVVEVANDLPSIDLSLRAPNAITEERSLMEFFPLRNYIFFNSGSTAVPSKYVQLSTSQAQSFQEQSLLNDPGTGSGSSLDRSQRQMSVYYNALNVFGDRLRSNPSAKVTLIGGAPNQNDALAMANSVKDYLVNTFGIDAGRITTKGQIRTPNASGTRVTPKEDLPLVAEENVRVEVQSDDPNMLKPVMIRTTQTALLDNDLVVNVNSRGPIEDYTVAITGNGYSQTYGPYRATSQRIDARPILAGANSGDYTATVTARTSDGRTVVQQQNFHLMRQTTPPTTGERFSILFEYDESKTVQTYEQFLRNEVAPKIPNNSTIVIHGHTDKIGLEDYNLELSSRRAMETQNILQDEMRKMGRTVTVDPYGFGEDESRAPFTNGTPEGRYYDRTVMIEVIPAS
jgi:outer membrane protein OmpA-like peptidoglycan-associated protein